MESRSKHVPRSGTATNGMARISLLQEGVQVKSN